MRERDPDIDAWISEARAVPLLDALAKISTGAAGALKRHGHEMTGPCPACGGTDRYSIHTQKAMWHCRKCGQGGHDSIGLAMHAGSLEFFAAVEILAGRPNPRGQAMSEAERNAIRRRAQISDAKFMGQQHFARCEARGQAGTKPQHCVPDALADDADLARAFCEGFSRAHDAWRTAERYRERDRARADAIWRAAKPMADSPLLHYFAHRKIYALPPGLCLRYAADLPLTDGRDAQGNATIVHRGACMIAPVIDTKTGARVGIHRTWLSWTGKTFSTEKGTAAVRSETGEPLTKMALGSKKGCIIPLGGGADHDSPLRWRDAHTIVMGEGRETVLAVYFRLLRAGADLRGWFFASSIDLGNIGGPALDRVKHPTRLNKNGRPAKVPGLEPDMEQRGILIPGNCERLILLSDGDSDAFDTENCLRRGARRFMRQRQALIANGQARQPLTVQIADPAAGMDFDDFNRATLSCGATAYRLHEPHTPASLSIDIQGVAA